MVVKTDVNHYIKGLVEGKHQKAHTDDKPIFDDFQKYVKEDTQNKKVQEHLIQ